MTEFIDVPRLVTIVKKAIREGGEQGRHPLFSVFIDSYCGRSNPPAWDENSHPRPLQEALKESADLRREGWITKIEPVT